MKDSRPEWPEWIVHHLALVRDIADRVYRVVGEHVEYDELLSLGTAGLLEAAKRYDPTLGTCFSTFAYRRIRGSIYDGLRRMGPIPRAHYRRRAEVSPAALAATDVRSPGHDDDLRELRAALRTVAMIFVTTTDPEELEQTLPVPRELAADEFLLQKRIAGRLAEAIASLPERERHLIRRCYFEDKTLREAGEELGKSPSWASRMHARAVTRLRAMLSVDDG